MPSRPLFLWLLAAFVLQLSSATAHASDLRARVDSLLAQEPLTGTSWSILFSSLDGKQEFLSVDADRLLVPASVTKIWSTAAALSMYGPDHKFVTRFSAQGALDGQGVLNGNLVCICGGDPAFDLKVRNGWGQPALDRIATELHTKGLRRVTGDLLVYTGIYRKSCGNGVWEMGDLREGFAPAVDAIGFNSNVCHVKIEPGVGEGNPAICTLDPPFAEITIENSVLTVSSGNDSWVEFNVVPCRNELTLTGYMARGSEPQYIWFPIQEPAKYFGDALRDALAKKGVTVSGQSVIRREQAPSGVSTLFEWTSPPLAELIAVTNKDSDNYLAEYLFSALGAKKHGEGSREAAVRALTSFARDHGIERGQFSLQDGSGLSRQNLVSARANVELLSSMAHSQNSSAFEASLSQNSVDGTMKGRLSEGALSGRVRAKTGTMTNVSTLAGYVGLDNGQTIAFAILSNNFRCSRHFVRNVQDSIIRIVFDAVNGGT